MPLDVLGIDASRASAERKTGTEWYSREIIRSIAEIEDRPELRLFQRERERFLDDPFVEWIAVNRRRFWTHTGLAVALRHSPVDALFVPSHVIPWCHPGATVVTIHDLGYRFEPEAHPRQRRAMLEVTTRWNARRAARIIVPSTATRDDLEVEYGVDPTSIDVIPHGVDHQRFHRMSRDEVDRKLSLIGVRRPYILFVSTIQPRKNLARLVAAFESLSHPDLHLVVAGANGWMADPTLARIKESPRRDAIIQLGYVADDALPALYNGAEAFALPSLYEGFGMGVLEAMACGCPVVTSSVSSLPEVAGDAAIVVDPTSEREIRESLLHALDPVVAPKLKAKGLERASAFTWHRAANQTLDAIRHAYAEAARQ